MMKMIRVDRQEKMEVLKNSKNERYSADTRLDMLELAGLEVELRRLAL